MDWNLEGSCVSGVYLGIFPYTGRVVASRVKYGGDVQHTVELDTPFEIYGTLRKVLLADAEELTVQDLTSA